MKKRSSISSVGSKIRASSPAKSPNYSAKSGAVGNAATHAIVGDHRTALATLKLTWQLGVWFHRTFANPAFKSGPFVPPEPPKDESEELRAELRILREAFLESGAANRDAEERLVSTETSLKEANDEKAFWEQMAVETEQAKAALEEKLAGEQAKAVTQPRAQVAALLTAATTAASAVVLDEADTRKLIDDQLRNAGWIADTATLSFGKGARPQKGKNIAIAECRLRAGRRTTSCSLDSCPSLPSRPSARTSTSRALFSRPSATAATSGQAKARSRRTVHGATTADHRGVKSRSGSVTPRG